MEDAILANTDEQNLFVDNKNCLIDDPFIRLTSHQAEITAKSFTQTFKLTNQEDVFVKAAKVLRDPEVWRSVRELNGEERDILDGETQKGFWKQPKDLRVTIVALCVAAVVQGWNQTANNGANLYWPTELGLALSSTACNPKTPDAWAFAIVNAIPYLSASFVGCWLSDPLNEYFYGRRSAICISAVLILASMIGGAFSQTWQELLICRAILGIGMGCKAAVVPVLAAEVSPAHIRGILVMNWQLFDALGILLGFTANLAVSGTGRNAWRLQTASSVLPTIVLLSLIWTASESPRFLMTRGAHRYRDAYANLLSLRGHPILAAKELLHIHYQMEVEKRCFSGKSLDEEAEVASRNTHLKKTQQKRECTPHRVCNLFAPPKAINYWQKLGQLFSIRRVRRAMVAAVVCMVSQQLCGVNVLALYSSTLFCDAEYNLSGNQKALFLSWGIGLTNFLFAFPAYKLIDRYGRRWLLLVALPFMAMSMLAAGLSFLIPRENSAHVPIITLFSYTFICLYSFSMGPVPFTLSAEVFPIEHRMVGMSFAVFTNFLGIGLLTLLVPAITVYLGNTLLLIIFAILNVVAYVLVFLFVRETCGAALRNIPGSMSFMSLEALNYVFGVSSKQYMMYQFKTVLPWAWKHYVLRDQSCPAEPEELYTWAWADRRRNTNHNHDQ